MLCIPLPSPRAPREKPSQSKTQYLFLETAFWILLVQVAYLRFRLFARVGKNFFQYLSHPFVRMVSENQIQRMKYQNQCDDEKNPLDEMRYSGDSEFLHTLAQEELC